MARPTKYTPERVDVICKAIEEGKKYEEAAALAGVKPATFYEWQAEKVEFAEAVKRARAGYEEWEKHGILEDAKRSLKELVCGMTLEETKTEYQNDKDGAPTIRRVITTTKQIPPNPTAIIFALCNRDPENWQNRVSQEVKGKIETETKGNISLKNVPTELLEQIVDAIDGETE